MQEFWWHLTTTVLDQAEVETSVEASVYERADRTAECGVCPTPPTHTTT